MIPLWVMVLCSITMGIGTSVGGMRIIKSVGMDMVKLERYQGFTADLSTAICLFLASAFGIPVSTTHTKTTAIMGVGASKRISSVDWRIVKEMLIAWILTFPGCGLIAYVMSKLFIAIFKERKTWHVKQFDYFGELNQLATNAYEAAKVLQEIVDNYSLENLVKIRSDSSIGKRE